MENLTKQFTDYLLYIGLVTPDTMELFLQSLNKTVLFNSSKEPIKLKPLLLNTFYEYLISLSGNFVQLISTTIVNKFLENRIKANKDVIEKLMNIYSKTLANKFELWRNLSKIKLTAQSYNFEEDSPIINYNNKSVNLRGANNSKYATNYYNQTISSGGFKPNSTTRSVHSSNQEQINNFNERLKLYSYYMQLKKESLERKKENMIDSACTFSPSICSNPICNTIDHMNSPSHRRTKSAFQKLYEESFQRQINLQFKTENYYQSLIKSNLNKPKKINKEKIEKLYNDHKRNMKRKKELQRQIDIERGITYQPDTCRNSSRIYERMMLNKSYKK